MNASIGETLISSYEMPDAGTKILPKHKKAPSCRVQLNPRAGDQREVCCCGIEGLMERRVLQ
jgi:hypothetical protein